MELSPPVYVDDSAMTMVYILGNTEIDAKAFTNVAVVGLFSKENKKGQYTYCKLGFVPYFFGYKTEFFPSKTISKI